MAFEIINKDDRHIKVKIVGIGKIGENVLGKMSNIEVGQFYYCSTENFEQFICNSNLLVCDMLLVIVDLSENNSFEMAQEIVKLSRLENTLTLVITPNRDKENERILLLNDIENSTILIDGKNINSDVDEVNLLVNAALCFINMIQNKTNYFALDFADLRMLFEKGDICHFIFERAVGEKKRVEILNKVLLHENMINFKKTEGAIINVVSNETSLEEIEGLVSEIADVLNINANIIWGYRFDEESLNEINISLILIGYRI